MKIDSQSLRYFPKPFAAWSLRQKLRNPFAGLRFFSRCSDGSALVVSRHWPHQLCWSWGLYWDWPARTPWRGHFYRTNTGGSWRLGPFRWSWQNYDDMVATSREADVLSFVGARVSPTPTPSTPTDAQRPKAREALRNNQLRQL